MSERDPTDVLTIHRLQDSETLHLRVSGELDLFTEPALIDAVRTHVADSPGARVLLDVTGVTFIDSSGLRALLVSRDETARAGKAMVLSVCPGPVTRLMDIAGVAAWFSYA